MKPDDGIEMWDGDGIVPEWVLEQKRAEERARIERIADINRKIKEQRDAAIEAGKQRRIQRQRLCELKKKPLLIRCHRFDTEYLSDHEVILTVITTMLPFDFEQFDKIPRPSMTLRYPAVDNDTMQMPVANQFVKPKVKSFHYKVINSIPNFADEQNHSYINIYKYTITITYTKMHNRSAEQQAIWRSISGAVSTQQVAKPRNRAVAHLPERSRHPKPRLVRAR